MQVGRWRVLIDTKVIDRRRTNLEVVVIWEM